MKVLAKLSLTKEEREVIADALWHYQRYCRYKRRVPKMYGEVRDHFDLARLCVRLLEKIE